MADDFLIGLGLGALIVGPPLAIATWILSENGYNEGMKGKKLVWKDGIFGILGQTEDGILVSVPHFERGREVRLMIRNLEWEVYKLKEDYKELRVAYTVSQGKINMLEDNMEKLRVKMEELKRVALTPDLRNKLEELVSILDSIKERQTNRRVPHYQMIL